MREAYDDVAKKWSLLAEATYREAESLDGDEEMVRAVYGRFKNEEEALFNSTGWTYEEFRAATLSRVSGELGSSGNVQQ